jgi:hypothetical protein
MLLVAEDDLVLWRDVVEEATHALYGTNNDYTLARLRVVLAEMEDMLVWEEDEGD